MSRVEIIPATLRDVTFIGAHMREQDRVEALATIDVASAQIAAVISFQASDPDTRWVALLDGQPVAAFGITARHELQPQHRTAWAFGTDKMVRAIPAITRFARTDWPARMLSEGCHRLQAASHEAHGQAHGWLEAIGARFECELPEWGVNGETFRMHVWKASEWREIKEAA